MSSRLASDFESAIYDRALTTVRYGNDDALKSPTVKLAREMLVMQQKNGHEGGQDTMAFATLSSHLNILEVVRRMEEPDIRAMLASEAEEAKRKNCQKPDAAKAPITRARV